MKKMDKRIKKRIGALVILGILTAIVLSPVITAVLVVPGPPDGRIEMRDNEWIGLAPGGRIIFDAQGAPDEIEIVGAYVGIGSTDVDARQIPARLYVTSDNLVEPDNIFNGVLFEQHFRANQDPDFANALFINPNLAAGIHNNVDYFGIRIQPVIEPGVISDWYGICIENPNLQGGAIRQGHNHALVTDLGAGNIGFGTLTPDPNARLDINGLIQIQGGNPQPGMVLTATNNQGLAIFRKLDRSRAWD